MDGLAALTVMVVEDEWLVRMELTAAFEDEHFTVLEAASAEEALAGFHLRQNLGSRVDLLVTDIRLTGAMTGWDLAAQARALDPDIAVVYVSANPLAHGRDVPGSVFIEKPALITQVVAAARRLLAPG